METSVSSLQKPNRQLRFRYRCRCRPQIRSLRTHQNKSRSVTLPPQLSAALRVYRPSHAMRSESRFLVNYKLVQKARHCVIEHLPSFCPRCFHPPHRDLLEGTPFGFRNTTPHEQQGSDAYDPIENKSSRCGEQIHQGKKGQGNKERPAPQADCRH